MVDTMSSETHRDKLLALRESLLGAAESGKASEQTVELDQARIGRLTRMDAMQAQAMSVATGRRLRERLRQIDAALARLERGTYGQCLDCGEAVGARRLGIDPAAGFCIECAEAREGDQ